MRTGLSQAFLEAEVAEFKPLDLRVAVRPNPESLTWAKQFEQTGLSGLPADYFGNTGWRGANSEAYGARIVTPAGTLLRTYGRDWLYGAAAPNRIYINRVPGGSGDPTLAQLENWAVVVTGNANVTREALSVDAQRVRLFFVQGGNPNTIGYVDSTNDAQTFGSFQSLLPAPGASTVLASPRPDMLFIAYRQIGVGLIAMINEGGTWVRHDHPMPTTRHMTAENDFWNASFQFDCAFVDEATGEVVCVVLDDLSGRAAATVYRNGHWSDYFPIEAIDFAEPERDDLIGYRMQRIGNKILLAARRTMSDTDWTTNQHGVLYYSTNGWQWSDAYYIAEGSQYNFGTPLLWRDKLWLVGNDALWSATPTTLLGGVSSTELDITNSVLNLTVDEPEDQRTPASVSLTLDNAQRQWLDHPIVTTGAEIDVQVGYAGTERVTLFVGKLEPSRPEATRTESRLSLRAYDYSSNLKEGQAERVIEYPFPSNRAILFASEDDLRLMSQSKGSWTVASEDGVGFARATKAEQNIVSLGTGLPGHRTFSARLRLTEPGRAAWAHDPGTVPSTATVQAALMFSVSEDFRDYYVVRVGKGNTGVELWKQWLGTATLLGRSTDLALYFNRWFRLITVQLGERINVFWQYEDDQNAYLLLSVTDSNPLVASGIVAVRATIPADAPQAGAYDTVDVDDVRVHSHTFTTTMEEFLAGIAFQRGFEAAASEQAYTNEFTSLSGLTVRSGSSSTHGAWSIDAGLRLVDTSGDTYAPRAVRTDIYGENMIVDMDVVLGDTLSGDNNWGRIGILARADAAMDTFVAVSVDAYSSTLSTPYSQVTLQVRGIGEGYTVPALLHYQYLPAIQTLKPGREVRLRFVVMGPWYLVYANRMLLASFYEPRLIRAGYWGITPGLGVSGGKVRVKRMTIPALDFGLLPFVKPGDTLDQGIMELLAGRQAWMRADGRTLVTGLSMPQTTSATMDDTVLLGAGFEVSADEPVSHMRVVSTTQDSLEVSGTIYSPTLWRRYGRARWGIREVKGLNSEDACRATAWTLLLEQERQSRTRSYPTHLRLTWQRNDLFHVVNRLDDTEQTLYLTGIERTFERDRHTGTVTARQTVRLEEQNAAALDANELRPYEGRYA